ncbi:TIR domain-containing protein [Cupriavidus sp. AcVe19-6a]|uniref:TIR domain-containing protein n=1 Tax=Cupriavidus sp. AcVe19-6a TaxID=2821358 RepID=UPI001AE492C9|nr:TIR domain-containing protein [Cupriavidus sp. AcVe19-6a]MBP0639869.1 nucleotide-binding protein [Cupriavidus sp. AcVe19-6a]
MTLIERFQNKVVLIEALLAQGIVQGDREVATALADSGEVVEFAAGEVLIHENATDRDMYFLLFGKVGVSVKGKFLYHREKKVTVGEMSAVNPHITRSATITAVEPTVTLKASPEALDQVAMAQPRVYRLIAAELASRLLQRNSLIRPPNDRPRAFFISSKESVSVAKAIRHGLRYTDADSLLWSDEDIFPPGSYPLEVLEREVDQADFGVAIAHPDDIVQSRGKQSAAPRDNVLFELGFFMSRLGRERTFLLVPEMEADLKLPSDFKGMTPIMYPPLTGKPGEVPVRVLTAPIYALEQKFQQLGCREP